jgi:O-antigen ligase
MFSKSNSEIFRNRLCYAFLALLVWMPVPLGSKHPWAISIAEVWSYMLAAIVVVHLIRYRHPLPEAFRTARIALILLTLNLGWILIQCIPLPLSWLQTLSPAAAELYSQSGVSQAPISLDASTTFYQFQTAAFLLIFFCLTLYLINTKQRMKWLVYTVLISALLQVVYGSLMILTGVEHSFFITKSALSSHIGSATGTFTNRDHLAGYLEMALALGVGLMLTMLSAKGSVHNWRMRIGRWLELLFGPKTRLRILLILLCLGLVMTHSRGGNLGFFVSLGVTSLLFLLLARNKPRAAAIFLVSLVILDLVIIGSWVGISKVVSRLEQTTLQSEGRDDAYMATLPIIEDYPLTGIGAGNYFNTFPAYKPPQLSGYWNHAHNDYLEIMAEQGLIGFSLLAGVVLCSLFFAVQTLRKRRNPFALGMSFASLMGITAMLIHSIVDFNLQILANSSMFVLLLAIPFICRHLRRSQGQKEAFAPL